MGYEAALLFSEAPECKVLAVARSKDKLEKLAGLAKHNNIIPMALDISDPASLEKITKEVNTRGGLDILINNAAILINKKFSEIHSAEWQEVFRINVFAPVNLIQILLPYLRKSNTAHIVNIGSIGGFQGSQKFEGLSAYSASKAALANITECLAEELKEDHVKINCLALGAVQTDMLSAAFPGYKAPVDAAEMAQFIVDFSQKGHRYFNGKILPVSTTAP